MFFINTPLMKMYLPTKIGGSKSCSHRFQYILFFILNGLNPQLFNAEVNREWVVVAKR